MRPSAVASLALLLIGAPLHAATDAPPAAVQKAMQDELARSMSDLRLGDEPRPYYLAYSISDLEQSTVSAGAGSTGGLSLPLSRRSVSICCTSRLGLVADTGTKPDSAPQ